MFGALLNRATICTYDLRTRGPRDFADWANAQRITTAWFVPSMLRSIADAPNPVRMESVRSVSFGGEALYWRDVQRARELFAVDTPMKNTLGSTEAGGLASYQIPNDTRLDDGPVPIGLPDPSVELTLVDEDGREVIDGEPGRIVVVRQDGRLALGYWNDPELTAAHFFVTPDGRRGFRTPDLARWRPDGLLEHLQRIDSRVKVRGAMVATSTVEQALITLPDVADAAVIGVPAKDGGTHLIAYVVTRRGAALSAWKLRRDVGQRLPSTYVPSAFVALDELPRTVRNKIDRKALPPAPPVIVPPYREGVGQQRELCEMFADILGVEKVGLDDDFFDLGGDSLGVVELVAAISERFGIDVPASLVLEAPTVAVLAPRLTHRRDGRAPTVVPLRRDGAGLPFFCFTGGGAPAISLRALSETNERPFYGIQPTRPRGAGVPRPQRRGRRPPRTPRRARRATDGPVPPRGVLLRRARCLRARLPPRGSGRAHRATRHPRHAGSRSRPHAQRPAPFPGRDIAAGRARHRSPEADRRRGSNRALCGEVGGCARRTTVRAHRARDSFPAAGSTNTSSSSASTVGWPASTAPLPASSTHPRWWCAPQKQTRADRERTGSTTSVGPSGFTVRSPWSRCRALTSGCSGGQPLSTWEAFFRPRSSGSRKDPGYILRMPDVTDVQLAAWQRNALFPNGARELSPALHEIARQRPDRLAVDDGERRVTFSELLSRTNRIANAILDHNPDPANPVVALCSHGIDPITSVLGVVSAGHLVSPLDGRDPADRLAQIVVRSGAAVIVAERELADLAREIGPQCDVLVLDDALAYPDIAPSDDHHRHDPGVDRLHVRLHRRTPKGVVQSHRALVAKGLVRAFGGEVHAGDHVVLNSSFSFSATFSRIFTTVMSGASLFTYDPRVRGQRGYAEWINENEITSLSFMTPLLRALLDVPNTPMMPAVPRGAGWRRHGVRHRHLAGASPVPSGHRVHGRLLVHRDGRRVQLRDPAGG